MWPHLDNCYTVTSNAEANADTTDEPAGTESTHIISTSPSNPTTTAAASNCSIGGDQKEAVAGVSETDVDSLQVISETLVLSETEIRSRKSISSTTAGISS